MGEAIGWAVKQMHNGEKVRRAGWNGVGMFIVLRQAVPELPYVAMFTATKQWQPGWVCSQADLLATDWEIV